MKRLYAPSKSARRSAHASGFCGTCATAEPDITNDNATWNNLITTSSMLWKGNTQKVGVIHPPPAFVGSWHPSNSAGSPRRGRRAARPQACLDCGNRPCLSAFVTHARGAECPMPTIKKILLGLVLVAGILSPGQVFADRAPSPEERSRIETMLRNEGFTRWGKIELDDDDDVWEVDGAYASDGRRYDLKVHPDTLAIIEREAD